MGDELGWWVVLQVTLMDPGRVVMMIKGTTLPFVPMEGLRLIFEGFSFTIQDLEWNQKERTFRAYTKSESFLVGGMDSAIEAYKKVGFGIVEPRA